MAAKQEFESRFAKHKDELEWLFMELYHNREGLEVLEREMAEAYNARSAELKALDKARSADPEWYKRGNMFGMTMYTDLFAGNGGKFLQDFSFLPFQAGYILFYFPQSGANFTIRTAAFRHLNRFGFRFRCNGARLCLCIRVEQKLAILV